MEPVESLETDKKTKKRWIITRCAFARCNVALDLIEAKGKWPYPEKKEYPDGMKPYEPPDSPKWII